MQAIFHPQAWQNDYAIDVDAEGPVEWTVDDEFVTNLIVNWNGPEDDVADFFRSSSYLSDEVRNCPNAPEWVREWAGPFWVEVIPNVYDVSLSLDFEEDQGYGGEQIEARNLEDAVAKAEAQWGDDVVLVEGPDGARELVL